MVVDKSKQVVPTTNQLALSLVLYKFHFLILPDFFNTVYEIFKDCLTSGLRENIIDSFIMA